MPNEMPAPDWRNFAAWSAVGAVGYVLAVWGGALLASGDGIGHVIAAMLRSAQVAAMLSLGLILAMAVTGFTSRKRPLTLHTLRNFALQNVAAVAACLLVIWGFSNFARAGEIGPSEWAAAMTGATLIVMACLGSLVLGAVTAGMDLVDDEMAAYELRERGRLIFYSMVWMAACGALLIVLGIAGAGLLSANAALAAALGLIAVLTLLGVVCWRMSDELGRALSNESGNMAFYLILVAGGGWAMLAHLGFVAGPAPLDWLTLFTVLLFAASFIVMGRRKLLTR